MQIVDLTHPIEEGMPTFDAPWHPKVKVRQMGRIEVEGRESRAIALGSHTGTHIDAPLHFIPGSASIDKLPLDVLVGPVTILDLRHLAPKTCIGLDDVRSWPHAERLMLWYGWDERWPEMTFYDDYPYLSKDAAKYLVEQGVRLLAYDSPAPDHPDNVLGGDEDMPIHKIFLEAGIVLVEYVANIGALPDLDGWSLVAAPLKIKGSDGAPARVFVMRGP